MKLKSLFALSTVLGVTLSASSALASTACPENYLGGQTPVVTTSVVQKGVQEVCYRDFADLDAVSTRTPLYAAEHLTEEQVEASKGKSRKGIDFHPESRLPYQWQAQLADYKSSGYDRGHMANWADTADPDTFTLGNMVPQDPNNNRELWEGIEQTTRDLAEDEGEVYVVSVPVFRAPITYLKSEGRVAVPDYIAKAIYVPATGLAGAYLVENGPGFAWTTLSLDGLAQLSGVRAFPGLPESVTSRRVALPLPNVKGAKIPMKNSIPSSFKSTPKAGDDRSADKSWPGVTSMLGGWSGRPD